MNRTAITMVMLMEGEGVVDSFLTAAHPTTMGGSPLKMGVGEGDRAISLVMLMVVLEAVVEALFRLRAEHGTTLVLVTHAPELANRCGRIVHLADGQVVGKSSAEPDRIVGVD